MKAVQPSFLIEPLGFDPRTQCASFNVQLADGVPHRTEELDVAKLFECYPDLRRHRCESGRHRSFVTEAAQTETAHLLEHLAVELLALSGVSRDVARGQTGIPRCLPATALVPPVGAPVTSERSEGRRRQGSYPVVYRLRFYGTDSLEEMGTLLHNAANIFEDLLLV